MKRFLLLTLSALFYVAFATMIASWACSAEYDTETENGAAWDTFAAEHEQSAEERVIDLPMDSQKWYISVIGNPNDMQYRSILRRFDRNKYLKNLKIQVHFWVVPTTSPAYKARYEKNTKILPTIRVQQSNGQVVWEAASRGIPVTAEGLYVAIKNSSLKAMALLPWRRNGTVLPWRDKMEKQCQPEPTPAPPEPFPVFVDLNPAPIDDGGPPEFEETGPARWLVVCLAVLSALAGGASALIVQARKSAASE